MSGYQPSLQALLAETGLLGCLAPGAGDLSREVSGLVFLETAADSANIGANQLVLVSGQAVRELTAAGLVRHASDAEAAGLVVRHAEEDLAGEAAGHRMPLVLLPPSSSWAGVLEALQHGLDRARAARPTAASGPRDALLDLAESLSRATGNPVTVEDPQFAVKAYSSQSGELDPVRVQTILSRRAPEAVRKGFEKYGVMRVLGAARGPVRIEPIPAMGLNGTRVVVPIRAGGLLLGYIWVIEAARRLEEGEMELLAGAARTAAALIQEQQAERNLQLRLQDEFLRDVFTGQIRSEDEAVGRMQSLGLGLGHCRVAMVVDLGDGAASARELVPVCRAELERLQLNGLAGEQPGGVWLLLAFPGTGAGGAAAAGAGWASRAAEAVRQAREAGEALLAAAPGAGAPASGAGARTGSAAATVGIGSPFRLMTEARASLQQAQSAVTLGRSLWAGSRVVQCDDLGAYRLLDRPAGPAEVEAQSHPVIRTLARYDAENGTDLLPTLEAYFDQAGNVRRAAKALTVHPNTMLYRLQRMADIAGLDTEDAGQRFVLELEFRLRRLAGGGR